MTNLATTTPTESHASPFEPQSLEQALSLATTLSKSGIIPDALRGKPADVLVILMTGRELGIGPMQSLRGISVIKGKPVLSADLMVAQCLRHRGVCEFFRLVESTPTMARYQTKRVGSEPVDLAWSMEDARRAGLESSQNWRNHPAAMLRARCSSALARAVYPDLVGGIYEESEGEEIAGKARPATVSSLPAPAPREQAPAIDVHSEPVPTESVEAEKPPAKPPTPHHVHSLWDALVGQFGDDKPKIQAVVSRAATTLWGDVVPPKHAWTEADCAQLLKISQEEAAP